MPDTEFNQAAIADDSQTIREPKYHGKRRIVKLLADLAANTKDDKIKLEAIKLLIQLKPSKSDIKQQLADTKQSPEINRLLGLE